MSTWYNRLCCFLFGCVADTTGVFLSSNPSIVQTRCPFCGKLYAENTNKPWEKPVSWNSVLKKELR